MHEVAVQRLTWRNRNAQAASERWTYDLATQAEWEKTARGVDGRAFPCGHRFDLSLEICLPRKRGYLLDEPGGSEPRADSPYGVLDLTGSRDEWTRDRVEGQAMPTCNRRGGHWGTFSEIVFRSASRAQSAADYAARSTGFRLVLRPARYDEDRDHRVGRGDVPAQADRLGRRAERIAPLRVAALQDDAAVLVVPEALGPAEASAADEREVAERRPGDRGGVGDDVALLGRRREPVGARDPLADRRPGRSSRRRSGL